MLRSLYRKKTIKKNSKSSLLYFPVIVIKVVNMKLKCNKAVEETAVPIQFFYCRDILLASF